MILIGGSRSSRAHNRFCLGATLAGGMAAAMLCFGMARAQDVPPDPALLERLGIMMTHSGLDTANQNGITSLNGIASPSTFAV